MRGRSLVIIEVLTMSRSKTIAPRAVAVREESTLARVERHLRQREYSAALHLVSQPGHDPELRNAKGVCLLRMGEYKAAMPVLRELVYNAGSVWVRPEAPTPHKVNFATALLLTGNLVGCKDMLAQAMDDQHPGVMRMRACLRRWEKGLTWWQWLNWKFGGVSESMGQVPLDFEPGLLPDGSVQELPEAETTSSEPNLTT